MSTREEVAVVVVVVMMVAAFVVDVEGVVGGVAAAELVLSWGREGHVAVRVIVVVVKHEVAKGFSGDLATFHHHVEV